MKNLFKRIHNDKNEKGSGIILVIVALSFLGIIAGALLTAVAYAYRLKLYDYNAKDNFHYVEQAMDEVYAGLGGRTTEAMQNAYTKTVEEMVVFDIDLRAYKNISDDEANVKFKKYFMDGIKDDPAFHNIETLKKLIQSYISNSTVEVVSDNMKVVFYDEEGNVVTSLTSSTQISKIVIQNLVLRRTANYQRSSASGTFTQTISTDVEISKPDFNVQFNTVSADNSVLFDYALIADSGIEINKSAASTLLINGNIYAKNDFYNKDYNQYGVTDTSVKQKYADVKNNNTITNKPDVDVSFDPVTSKTYTSDGEFLFNARLADQKYGNNDGIFEDEEYKAKKESLKTARDVLYNGYNENSRYSGLYINGAKVSIMADTIVVPGSIAIMNGANLNVYNSTGTKMAKTNVWADNVVLGGYTYNVPSGKNTVKVGSKATFVADMYVRDDLEINSDSSAFKLLGGYYGYGNGTQVKRTFVPTIYTDKTVNGTTDTNYVNVYQYGNTSDSAQDRSHYNSSAIVVNGEDSVVDLSDVTTLYVAGQAYVELSAKHEDVLSKVSDDGGEIVYASGSADKQDVNKEVLTFDPSVQDYKTGESLSVKSNQLIYIPNGTGEYDVDNKTVKINKMLTTTRKVGSTDYNLFKAFFKDTDKVPYVSIVPAGSNRTYYYFDFGRIWEEDNKGYESAEAMAAAFATAYIDELNMSSSSLSANFSPIKEYLDQDVTNGSLFSAGDITLPKESANVYASGALTSITSGISTTTNKTYKLIVSKEEGVSRPITADNDSSSAKTSSTAGAILLSSEFAKHYNYLKFSLVDLASDSVEAKFVDDVVNSADYGESALTPLNRYFVMNGFTSSFKDIKPSNDSDSGVVDGKLNLSSGYKVWVTHSDVEIKPSYCDLDDGVTVLRGIIISEGDVTFDPGVDRFEGLIVAGGKIYIGNDVTAISASPEICKAILTELRTEKDPDAEKALRFFVGFKTQYDDMTKEELKTLCEQKGLTPTADTKEAYITALIANDNGGDKTTKKINTIDYSDVIRYSNWMKNSE